MWKIRIALTLVCGACIVFLAWFAWTSRDIATPEQLRVWRTELTDLDPTVRLTAAEGLLKHTGEDIDVRFVRAEALASLHRHDSARDELADLISQDWHGLRDSLRLMIECNLLDARSRIAAASPHTVEFVTGAVEPLLAETQDLIELLRTEGGSNIDAFVYEARVVAHRVGVSWLALRAMQIDRDKVEASEAIEEAQLLDLDYEKARLDLGKWETRLIEACETVIGIDPSNPWGYRLMFEMHFGRQRFEKARQIAERVANERFVERRLAGELASALINIELSDAIMTTDNDVQLAGMLLNHEGLYGDAESHYHLGYAAWSLVNGDTQTAREHCTDVLAVSPTHPRARCHLAMALISERRFDDAIAVIGPVMSTHRIAQAHYLYGAALLTRNRPEDVSEGIKHLRKALDLDESLLAARLMLAETMVAQGFLNDAEQDVIAAVGIQPNHPRVEAIRARLMVEAMDLEAVRKAIDQRAASEHTPLTADDVVLAVYMALDDDPTVRKHLQQRRRRQPYDVLTLIAAGWLDADRIERQEVAGTFVRGLIELVDVHPLQEPFPPSILAIDAPLPRHSSGPAAREATGAAKITADPLRTNRFVPWFENEALRLVIAAQRQWPDDKKLTAARALLEAWLGDDVGARVTFRELSDEDLADRPDLRAIRHWVNDQTREAQHLLADAQGQDADAAAWLWLQVMSAARRENANIEKPLRRLLAAHPWAGPVLMSLLRPHVEKSDMHLAERLMSTIEDACPNTALAQVMRARLDLCAGNAPQALQRIRFIVNRERDYAESSAFRFSTEVRARAVLTIGDPQMVRSMFERLTLEVKQDDRQMQIRAIDALLEAQRLDDAGTEIAVMFAEPKLPPVWLDALLARAVAVMPRSRVINLINTRLQIDRDNPLLLLYRAYCNEMYGKLDEAQKDIDAVLATQGNVPRAVMAKASVKQRKGRISDAIELYERLLETDGPSRAAAEDALRRMLATPQHQNAEVPIEPVEVPAD